MRLLAALLLFAACHKAELNAGADYRRTFTQTFREHEAELRTCWQHEFDKHRLEWETPIFRFTIKADGHVRDLVIGTAAKANPEVVACWHDAISAWVFPPPPDGRDYPVNYRWSMRPAQ
jgi:hypothetical protein